MLADLKGPVKGLLQAVLGPAYDYVMPSVGIPFPFLFPGSLLFAPFLVTASAFALVMYLAGKRQTEGKSLQGFLRFLVPASVYRHPSAWLDCKYYVANSLLTTYLRLSTLAFMFGGLLYTGEGARRAFEFLWGPSPQGIQPSFLAQVGYSVAIVVAADYAKWVAHYLQHKIPVLWDFHKVHHSALVLTPLTNLRVHPVDFMFENFLTAVLTGFVIGAYGYRYSDGIVEISILGLSLVYFLAAIVGNLRHSHIPLAYPRWFSKWVCSPVMHQIHHSAEERHFDKNFSLVFSAWDYLAGSLYIPEAGEKYRLGIGAEGAELRSVWTLYAYPFVSAVRRFYAPPKPPAERGDGPGAPLFPTSA